MSNIPKMGQLPTPKKIKHPSFSHLFPIKTTSSNDQPIKMVIWGCVITGIYFVMIDHH
jgi:hypothetical protein